VFLKSTEVAMPGYERWFSALTAERDISVSLALRYGSHPRQLLDVYDPAPGDDLGAVVVFYYGGAWTTGDRAIYGFVGAALAKRGVTAVIPDYRLFPEVAFPEFVGDAAEAYAWVANHKIGRGDHNRPLFLMGHSAGAHMAALLAYDPQYLNQAGADLPKPAGLIGLSGPYAFDPTTWPSTRDIFRSAAADPDRSRPVALVKPGAPPTLLLHGAGDDIVDVSAARHLHQALTARGVEAKSVEYPGVGHVGLVLTLSRPLRWRADSLDRTIAFIRAQSILQPLQQQTVAQAAE
jgi:acetyl esterase/lipase